MFVVVVDEFVEDRFDLAVNLASRPRTKNLVGRPCSARGEARIESLRSDPLPHRMGGDAAHVHPPGAELDGEGHMERAKENRVDGEEEPIRADLGHQLAQAGEDCSVDWPPSGALNSATQDRDLVSEHDDLDRQFVVFASAKPSNRGARTKATREKEAPAIFACTVPSGTVRVDGVDRVFGYYGVVPVPTHSSVGLLYPRIEQERQSHGC